MTTQSAEPYFITKVFSYIAIVVFFGGLAGLATVRWDLRRLYFTDVAHLAGAEDREGHERADKFGDRFMPGFCVGCVIGGLVLVGYHLQHSAERKAKAKGR